MGRQTYGGKRDRGMELNRMRMSKIGEAVHALHTPLHSFLECAVDQLAARLFARLVTGEKSVPKG